jgi:tellurium resistance protein TerZ
MTFVFKKNSEKSIHDLGGASPILVFALGWDSKGKAGFLGKIVGAKRHADLDLSCAMYDGNNDRTDCVWYAQLRSKCGAVRHKGDDTVGAEEGDDETIIMDMNQLNDEVQTLFFVVSCFSGECMGNVDKAYWRLFDAQTKREIARFDFAGDRNATAKIVMRLQKVTEKGLTKWNVKALDESATGKNIQEVFPEIRSLIEA